jgi:hypothetical protein
MPALPFCRPGVLRRPAAKREIDRSEIDRTCLALQIRSKASSVA